MAPRDHEGSEHAMRLILSGGEAYLAAGGRLVQVNGAERLAALIERVLVVTAVAGTAPRVQVETLRALTRVGDQLMAEVAGPRSAEPINVPVHEPQILVTLLDGHYRDRWTAEAFNVELVNTASASGEVTFDLYLPDLENDGGDAKKMTVQTDADSFEIEVHRGGPTPVSLPVERALSAAFWTTPEPYPENDARSRGVLVAAIRGSLGQVADVFHLSTYFD